MKTIIIIEKGGGAIVTSISDDIPKAQISKHLGLNEGDEWFAVRCVDIELIGDKMPQSLNFIHV